MAESTPTRLKRADILRSAAAAFRRRGYHGSSVGQIAQALGMTKGNLYYYFKDKEAILAACHQYSLDLLLAVLAEVQASRAAADVKLTRLIDAFVHMILDDLHGTALFFDLDSLNPRHRRQVIARRDEFDRGLRQVLREGMDQGVFTKTDPKLASFAILGAVNWIPRWFDPAGQARSDDIVEAFTRLFVGGLMTRSTRRTRTGTRRWPVRHKK